MVQAEQSSMRSPTVVTKVRIGVLDESTAAQLEAGLEASKDIELAWAGTSVAQLLADKPSVDVLLVNIDYLKSDPPNEMNDLVEATGAELGIALYAFAKRSLLDNISSPRIRTLRSPLNLPMLRCQMMGIIARNLLSQSGSRRTPPGDIRPPRYSRAALGKLQQISTAIECECPTHLSVLLQNLSDFEAYSKNCEDRNAEDAAVHRLLYETTARARALLEDAMDKLVEHENIQI